MPVKTKAAEATKDYVEMTVAALRKLIADRNLSAPSKAKTELVAVLEAAMMPDKPRTSRGLWEEKVLAFLASKPDEAFRAVEIKKAVESPHGCSNLLYRLHEANKVTSHQREEGGGYLWRHRPQRAAAKKAVPEVKEA
jgi:hypothetical protein